MHGLGFRFEVNCTKILTFFIIINQCLYFFRFDTSATVVLDYVASVGFFQTLREVVCGSSSGPAQPSGPSTLWLPVFSTTQQIHEKN